MTPRDSLVPRAWLPAMPGEICHQQPATPPRQAGVDPAPAGDHRELAAQLNTAYGAGRHRSTTLSTFHQG